MKKKKTRETKKTIDTLSEYLLKYIHRFLKASNVEKCGIFKRISFVNKVTMY